MVRITNYTIKDIVSIAKERINKDIENKDVINFWSGSRGSGKSTGALKFSFRFPQFNMKKHMVYSRDDVKRLMELKDQVIQDDEAIRTGYSRNFYEPDQIKLIEVLNMNRYHNNIYSGCIPTFKDLDINLRNLCTTWIHVIKKGEAIVNVPWENPFSKDKWDVDNNAKLIAHAINKQKKDPSYKIPWHRLSTFAGYLYFNSLTRNQYSQYEDIREFKRAALRDVEEVEAMDSKSKKFYDIMVEKLQKGMFSRQDLITIAISRNATYDGICNMLNKYLKVSGTSKRVSDFFKKDTQETRNSAGQKPSAYHDGESNYYTSSDVKKSIFITTPQ